MPVSYMTVAQAWLFLLFGYVVTVVIELPILVAGLDRRHGMRDRIVAGVLLTAFTYPVVVLVLPSVFTLVNIPSRGVYLLVAEVFAAVAEVVFFRFIFGRPLLTGPDRDAAIIVVANLASFLLGEIVLSQAILNVVRLLAA